MFEKLRNLKTNQKIILGVLSLIFALPIFFALLAFFSYKGVKNKVVNGILTSFLVILTLFSVPVWADMWFGNEDTKEIEDNQEQVLSETDEKPQEESSEENMEVENEEEQDEFYKVTSVSDGDTIRVLINGENQTVRLIGLDTPEINHQSEPVQCYGPEAKEFTETTLLDKNVKLEIDEVEGEKDQFDRLLRYIILEDGTNFNEQLIRQGYAWESTYTEGYKNQELFRNAEQEAKENNAGFWSPETCNGDVYTGTHKDPNRATSTPTPQPTVKANQSVAPPQNNTPPPSNSGGYSCNCGKSCGQMSSCDEAYYQLNQCGCSVRDGDNDGVPCESIC